MTWTHFLFPENCPENLSDAASELAALATGCVAVPLTRFGLIRFSGEESMPFLNGQLSSDVRHLAADQVQFSSYSTPKGRMLASFLVIPADGDYLLQLDSALQAAIQKRLSMYILRSKTRASNAGETLALIGLAGATAQQVLQARFGVVPTAMQQAVVGEIRIVALDESRFEIICLQADAAEIWQSLLDAGATAAGDALWRLADIRSGTPWVTAATQEDFVPQMANMDLIGAISFTKGCYPGQEIVARTRYLGKIKRRMFRMQAETVEIAAGTEVFAAAGDDQAIGKVVLAAPAGAGLSEALVVARIDLMEGGVHLGTPGGPALTLLAQPYTIMTDGE